MKRTLLLLVLLGAAPEPPAPDLDFPNDVLPRLTRLGCNTGACHGAATGQKGFRLSLLGTDPARDYEAIVRELRGRRIDLAEPEKSLLLRKPTRDLKHGGGRVLEAGSETWSVLVDWLRAGAPFRSSRPVDLVRISADPGKVTAIYSDGSTRDVTALALTTSNDDAIADQCSVNSGRRSRVSTSASRSPVNARTSSGVGRVPKASSVALLRKVASSQASSGSRP